ncbi:MAG: glycosyltransferase family 2 protein [Elusimicrobia bacterium]|nr:glycosyltransferase family 2 protein [Elusimicrobiota bacterium]
MLKKLIEKYILGRCGLYGFLLLLAGISIHILGFVFRFLENNVSDAFLDMSAPVILISGSLFAFDILALRNLFKKREEISATSLAGKTMAVGMTAYNDEECIADAAGDFIREPGVKTVIVIDNNCTDKTGEKARNAGAAVVAEIKQGFGYACMRALEEACRAGDIIVLVEGDGTFSAGDIRKLLPYLENFDMVCGTRTTNELNSPDSQLDWLMVLGNLFVAKLLQVRFWGSRFTDVGCTYRIMKKESYEKIRGKLSVGGMHFLPHMIIESIKAGLKIIEVPITFRKRQGISKGVGSKKLRAVAVGIRMALLILFS